MYRNLFQSQILCHENLVLEIPCCESIKKIFVTLPEIGFWFKISFRDGGVCFPSWRVSEWLAASLEMRCPLTGVAGSTPVPSAGFYLQKIL